MLLKGEASESHHKNIFHWEEGRGRKWYQTLLSQEILDTKVYKVILQGSFD